MYNDDTIQHGAHGAQFTTGYSTARLFSSLIFFDIKPSIATLYFLPQQHPQRLEGITPLGLTSAQIPDLPFIDDMHFDPVRVLTFQLSLTSSYPHCYPVRSYDCTYHLCITRSFHRSRMSHPCSSSVFLSSLNHKQFGMFSLLLREKVSILWIRNNNKRLTTPKVIHRRSNMGIRVRSYHG